MINNYGEKNDGVNFVLNAAEQYHRIPDDNPAEERNPDKTEDCYAIKRY
ncbi:MAG: hypothetical protein J1D85_06820 [Bacteroidales bacterium]|nr:hypothetical protein [Bacteroidales bacterium]